MSTKQNSANDKNERAEQPVRSFNPNEHLMQIKNRNGSADYLPVQWRLVWFREQCPQGTIETEMIHLDLDRETEEEGYAWNNDTRRSEKVIKRANGIAIFRAVVKDGKGGVATGTKSEKAASFPDFLEKAETGAIGRALAGLGYGTQFAPELDEQHRIVDAPVDRERAAAASESGGNGRKAIASVRPGANGEPLDSQPANALGATAAQSGRLQGTSQADENMASAPATEQQITSLRKLCQHLGRPEPENMDRLTYANAKELIVQLSHEYNEQRQSRSKAS